MPRSKEENRLYMAVYRASERGRAATLRAKKRYLSSASAVENRRLYNSEYRKTAEWSKARRSYLRKSKMNPRRRYSEYRWSAKQRGIEFSLSLLEFSGFWKKPCAYCGSNIDTIGLDRIDNEVGYTSDNVVPCCTRCNMMKGKQDRDSFISHCAEIVKNARIE